MIDFVSVFSHTIYRQFFFTSSVYFLTCFRQDKNVVFSIFSENTGRISLFYSIEKINFYSFLSFHLFASDWISQNFKYVELWQYLSLGEFFSYWKGGCCVIKLVAATVIRQHFFAFTLSNILYNNLWNKKRIWSFYSMEIMKNYQMWHQSTISAGDLTT